LITTNRSNMNEAKNTTQKTKQMSNMDSSTKNWINSCACEGWAVHDTYKTPVVLLPKKSYRWLKKEENNLHKRKKMHCHLRNVEFMMMTVELL